MNWKCKIGCHEKVSVEEGSMDEREYMIYALTKFAPIKEKEVWAETHIVHVFGFEYMQINKIHSIKNEVCVRCHKCFNNVDFTKMHIVKKAREYVKELETKEIKKKMAEDIYKEKCRDE